MINHLYDNKENVIKYINLYVKSVKNGNKIINHKIIDKKYDKININNDIFKYDMINKEKNDEFLYNFAQYYCDIVLYLLSEHPYDILDSKNEYKKIVKTKYIVNMAKNDEYIKLFCLTIMLYYMLAYTSTKKYYVIVDYEFTQRQIRLIQLNFETESIKNNYNQSFVWVCNPSELPDYIINLLIKKIMIRNKIIKITQGAESLDIPYVYEHMFKQNKKYILQFSKTFVDLRFLCEYFKATVKSTDKKCSIYDLLKFFNTISSKKYDYLEDVNYKLGPSQDREWDIHKMSSFHAKYAYYDVVFLKQALKDIIKKVKLETPLFINSYKFISHLVGFVCVEKWGISNIINDAKNEVDILNNYIIKYKNNNLTLFGIYSSFIENLVIPNINVDVNSLYSVSYLKTSLIILFKKIIYSILLDNYKIYKKKNEEYNDKLDIKKMITNLNDLKFDLVSKLLLELYNYANTILPNTMKL